MRTALALPLLAALALAEARSAAQGPQLRALPAGTIVELGRQHFGDLDIVSLKSGDILIDGLALAALFASSFKKKTVVIPSQSGRPNSGTSWSFLLPFRGDSALWFDRGSRSFLVIEPGGALGRVMAAPPTETEGWSALPRRSADYHLPVSSWALGLVYQISTRKSMDQRNTLLPPGIDSATVRVEDTTLVARMA